MCIVILSYDHAKYNTFSVHTYQSDARGHLLLCSKISEVFLALRIFLTVLSAISYLNHTAVPYAITSAAPCITAADA